MPDMKPADAVEDSAAHAELQALRDDVTALTDELLNRYEEVTLLQDLSRELGVVVDVEKAARTALLRCLQVVSARFGIVLVEADGEMGCGASCGSEGADGERLRLARVAGDLASLRGATLMFRAGEVIGDGPLVCPEPVLAAPLAEPDVAGQSRLSGALVLVGRDSPDEFTAGELALAAAVARQLGVGLNNANLVSALREADAVSRELEVAAEVQRSLLPAETPRIPGATVAAVCLPAARVGGDYYDFVRDDGGAIHGVVADVSGHGVGPGMIMAMTRSVLRGQLRSTGSLAEAVRSTNAIMWDDLTATSTFITAFAFRYHPDTRELGFCNAGHPPALLVRGDAVDELGSLDLPLGVLPEESFSDQARTLEPGDCLLVFSDGILETASPQGELFGYGPLKRLVAGRRSSSASDLLDRVLRDVQRFRGPASQEDDVTVMVIELTDEPSGGAPQ